MSKTAVLIPRYIIDNVLGGVEYEGLREDYSGRGMYGASCFGVVLPDERELNRFMFELGYEVRDLEDSDDPKQQQLADFLRNLVRSAHVDSMGLDVIAYFPGFLLGD